MNGAPEGKLVSVVVLERSELLPYVEDSQAVGDLSSLVLPILVSSVESPSKREWFEEFDALTALRRVLVYCPQAGNAEGVGVSSALPGLAQSVERGIRNSRSSVAKVPCSSALSYTSACFSTPSLLPLKKSLDWACRTRFYVVKICLRPVELVKGRRLQ